jgi:hypothetical protein
MRKLTLIMLLALVSQVLSAQIITDSIRTQASYANDVYYSLKNGEVKAVANNEWQLAFKIGVGGMAIRSNATTGSSGIGSVTVYEKPGKDTTQWGSFDTTGFSTWTLLNNTDSSWDLGAFNVNKDVANLIDFSWGLYNPVNHFVVGNRLYVVAVKTGASSYAYKKFWVVNNALGTWNIKYANLDGSNEQVKQIKSTDYAGHNFAYLSLMGDSVFNHEPLTTDWDFMLTRYAGLQTNVNPPVYYPVTGILTNTGVKTGEVRGINTTLSAIIDTTKMSSVISEIGSDWKQLNMQTFTYYTVDSLSYFVKAKDGNTWKVVFKGFSSSQGKVIFTKELVPALSTNKTEITFLSIGETAGVNVTSNTAWTVVTNEPSWVTLSAANGNGNGSIDVTASANASASTRMATVTFTAGALVKVVNLVQAGSLIDSLDTDKDTITFMGGQSNMSLELTSNTAWVITAIPSWVTITPATSGNGNAALTLDASANTTGSVRTADITITAGTVIRTVHLIQDIATGIAEVKEIRIINAYPNPSNGMVTVQNELNADASVEVFNLTGVKVDTFSIPASQSKSLDYNALPSGIYVLHIISDAGQQNMRLLISNK